MVDVTLITKPDCHLCDEAKPVVERIVAGFDGRVTLTERDLDSDPELRARWSQDIPVVLIDGQPHSSWRVDEGRLQLRLEQALA